MKKQVQNLHLFSILKKQTQHSNSLKEKKIYEQIFRKYLQHPQYLEEDIFNNMIYAKINDEIISHFLNHEKLKYNNLTGYNLNLFSIKFDLKNFKDSQNYSQHKSILQQILYKIFQNLSKNVTTLKLYLDGEIMNVGYILKIVYSYVRVNPNLKNIHLEIKNSQINHISQGLNYISDGNLKYNSFKLCLCKVKMGPGEIKLIDKFFINIQDVYLFSLYIQDCQIRSEELQYIGDKLKLFDQLKVLKLNFFKNQIQDQGLEHFSLSLSELSDQLEDLKINFYWNQITDFGVSHLIGDLTQYQNLKSLQLNLGKNKITDHSILFECLCQLKQLTTLALKFKKFKVHFDEIENFQEQFENLINLNEFKIDFSYNSLDIENVLSILSYLQKIPKLCQIKLIFKSCKFKSEEVQKIINIISSMKKLQFITLDLSWNELTDIQIENLIKVFSHNSELKKLKFIQNKINDEQIQEQYYKKFANISNCINIIHQN